VLTAVVTLTADALATNTATPSEDRFTCETSAHVLRNLLFLPLPLCRIGESELRALSLALHKRMYEEPHPLVSVVYCYSVLSLQLSTPQLYTDAI
jgi:hypothetical protein